MGRSRYLSGGSRLRTVPLVKFAELPRRRTHATQGAGSRVNDVILPPSGRA